MRLSHLPLTARRVAVALILVAVIGALAYRERRERLRNAAISRAEATYRDALLARELAEAAVNAYAEVTFPHELAVAECEIRGAEDELRLIRSTRDPLLEWAERIESKGYLLSIRGPRYAKQLAEKKATFAIEQAKSKKTFLEKYTKVKTLKDLNDRLTKARADELASKAAYSRLRATPVGFFARVMRRR
jgi:hypothetical protein